MTAYRFVRSALMVVCGCACGPAVKEPPAQSPDPIVRSSDQPSTMAPGAPSYCEQVAGAINNPAFKCVEPPNGAQVGTYGPIERPWLSELGTSCFSDSVPPALKDSKVPSAKQAWTRKESKTIDGGATIELSKILPFLPAKWLPAGGVTTKKSTAISYDISFDEAQIQTLSNIPKALRDRVGATEAPNANATQKRDIATCVSNLCGGSYTVSARAFIANVTIRFNATSASNFDSSIGWSQLGTDAHLKITTNADGSREISSKTPVVLAIEALDGKSLVRDLQDANVCPRPTGPLSLRDSIKHVASDFLESYQCVALRAGAELANSVCAGNTPPSCNASTAASSITVPPADTVNTCPPWQLLKAYQCRVQLFDQTILSRACTAFETEVNANLPPGASTISLNCNTQTTSGWMHDYGGTVLQDVHRAPPAQVRLAEELLSRATPEQIETIMSSWRLRFASQSTTTAHSSWVNAAAAYSWITWPTPQFSRTSWVDFQRGVLFEVMRQLRDGSHPNNRRGPGCSKFSIGWDARRSFWAFEPTASASSLRVRMGFPTERPPGDTANELALALVPPPGGETSTTPVSRESAGNLATGVR